MTNNKPNFLDIKAMEEEVKKDHEEQSRQFAERLEAKAEKARREQKEIQDLFAQAVAQDAEERRLTRDREIEAEQAKLKQEHQKAIEKAKGIKSDETVQQENALRGMLENMMK